MAAFTPDSATIGLAASSILAAYLSCRCWIPPNALSSVRADNRSIQIAFTILASWILHILIILSYPSSPPQLLCPHPENLAKHLFTWTPYTAAMIGTVLVAAPIRLLAFRHLGKNFTFHVTKPKQLINTGPYAYVQHPSYPTNWLVTTANLALLWRPDGVLGCVLPSSVVRFAMGNGVVGVWPALLAAFGFFGGWAVWIRVKHEEGVLQKQFGSEWEEYHRKTARFIPWVF
ncbi:putative prenyl cysteine carboxyl methyltransferase [Podospora didyma]|uniref:Protein-S-isoprenylcysteine O-methyltransferase n=1 Tax=Podospora didyma TaxID=330526 RepID=A0AAE0NHR3_9PEZI|nr:putative prenyl cysteine carboxyl methyltransferase [Podospora didyma]